MIMVLRSCRDDNAVSEGERKYAVEQAERQQAR